MEKNNKKINAKKIGIILFIILAILTIWNIYIWIVSGNQRIRISMPTKAYTDGELYVTITAQDYNVDLDTNTELKLLDFNGNQVKDVNVKYDGKTAVLSIPKIDAGNYYIEAKVSSSKGVDTVKKDIYLIDGKLENTTITLDKGIYKPGDTVNYRALLTSKENDEPVTMDINVSIYDGNDNKVYNENLKSSDYGIISGSFSLANEVNSGIYKLVVKTKNSETTKQFKVNPYVTPKYEVKVNYDKEKYLVGDTAKITFNAKYFFGEAVENADLTVYLNNSVYKKLKTDKQGIATIEYEIKEAKTNNIKVEAVDSSNYYVEATSSFTAGTDIFEVKLLPEYGDLAAGKKNNVYVFTNKADGTPVKAYVTVSSNNYTKQIATDKNGVGKFTVDVDSITNRYNSSTSSKKFSIEAEDEEGNEVNKSETLNVSQMNLLVSTDKVKYEQGEDIKIDISSANENANIIYVFKGDKLLKMVSTEADDTTINLDDNYGLIDIYVKEKNGSSNYYNSYNANSFRKTIFVKPSKQLSISINTDKEEYKPGEDISISFNALDENKNGVDSALLVSMLDNSVLNLANNDLSIDNIKLALQNIKFSNELDAATLYSCIIDDESEQTMMALLLKQSNTDINVSETEMNNYEQKHNAQVTSMILIAVIIVTIITFLCVKSKKFRNFMKHLANYIIFVTMIFSVIETFFYNYSYYWSSSNFWIILGISCLIGFVSYVLVIYKISPKIFRTSVSIIISVILWYVALIFNYGLGINPIQLLLIALAVASVVILIAKILEDKKLKISKYMKNIIKEIVYIFKYLAAVAIAVLLVGQMLYASRVGMITIPIVLVLLYFLNYLFNNLSEERVEKEKNNDRKITEISPQTFILGFFATIGIIFVSVYFSAMLSGGSDVINSSNMSDAEMSMNSNSGYSRSSGGLKPSDIQIKDTDAVSNTSSSKGSSLLEDFGNMFTSEERKTTSQEKVATNRQEIEKTTDEHVRNVFLESMCFIPELVTSNGKANIDLKLSDNITTWTIQTVGNTKDGRIGYGILDDVKVFKEFFVDFELPKNLVETDKVSIPVTVYNYTDNQISTVLKVKEEEWFKLENNNINITVDAKSTNMVYIPITVLKSGNSKFRAEVSSNNLTDIVEKECTVSPNGFKVEKVVSTGSLDEDISEDILVLDKIVDGTAKAKVKIYASTMSQAIEGMEKIFKMPTGCFEQISSSLYPNILALKYLEDNGIVDEKIKEKAISYISSGYQKILTYEVKGESGGYSLYGYSPAETVLTAYGLMEVSDLSKVYNVDQNVIDKMTKFLYNKQKSNGTFEITGSHLGGASSRDDLSLNAYITWALSESNPNDSRLRKSVDYLKSKINNINDNYTLALVANTLANVKDSELNSVLNRLVANVQTEGKSAYLTSNVVDYYGSRSKVQNIQTVALTSMALSKGSYASETNKLLINYLISTKDTYGTWHSTQATILALKALNERNAKNKLENQTIKVKVNSDEQNIEIKDNPLEYYELIFDKLNKENKLNIDIEKGSAYYEVVEEYYVPYDKVETKNDNLEIKVESNNDLKVNEILKTKIRVLNNSKNIISNGMVTISIPQGFTLVEDSLNELVSRGTIEKYETSYTSVNIYLRNFEASQIVNLDVCFRASYPVEITGMAIRAYDYYNPEVEGKSMPVKITVQQ